MLIHMKLFDKSKFLVILLLVVGCSNTEKQFDCAELSENYTEVQFNGEYYTGTCQCIEAKKVLCKKRFVRGTLVEDLKYTPEGLQIYQRGYDSLKNVHGEWIKWHENGQMASRQTYNHGLITGTTLMWYSNGNLRQEAAFEDDKFHGTYKEWYEDGAIREELNFLNGNQEGPFKVYHENGIVEFEGYCVDGKKDGVCTVRHSNGKVRLTGQFDNDSAVGTHQFFDTSGVLIKEIIFENGQPADSVFYEVPIPQENTN